MHEEELKDELNEAIIDCGFIANLILKELPDLEQIEILELAVKSMITYSLGYIKLCDNPGNLDTLSSELEQSLTEFRENVSITDYDTQSFVENMFEEILGD